MSQLSEAEKRVFGEHASRDENGNIVEKAIGFVKKEVRKLITLTEEEFHILVEKAKNWDDHVMNLEKRNPEPAPQTEPAKVEGEDSEEHF